MCPASSSPTRSTAPCQPPKQCFGLVRTRHVPTHVPDAQHEPIPPTNRSRTTSGIFWGKNPHSQCQWVPELDAYGNPRYVAIPALDRATQASIDANFVREQNYWLPYKIIKRACYNVLDETIDDAFKFSPDPNLTGWNPSMEIIKIMEQITTTYGRPTPTAFLKNDTLFQSPYLPIDAPEVLFRRIEDCQEIMTLGDNPYTPMQLLNNAIRMLLECGLYQRDFEEWDSKTAADKVRINLKPYIQEAYQCRLNATGNTSGHHGYMQNAFAVLEESDDDEDGDVATVITQMAALTTQIQLTAASTAVTSSSVASAIQQLNTRQQTMMQQMMTYANANTTRNPPTAHNPPLTHFNIPTIGTFQPGGNAQGGRRPGHGRGGRAPVIVPGGRRAPCTPFANYLTRQGGMGASIVPAVVPGVPGVDASARNTAPMYSNIVKRYSNMNVCFSCGFDVENGHTSRTCPQA